MEQRVFVIYCKAYALQTRAPKKQIHTAMPPCKCEFAETAPVFACDFRQRAFNNVHAHQRESCCSVGGLAATGPW